MTGITVHRAMVLGLLLVMGIVMALSVRDDTLTTDEGLYIPTGYMYLTEQNARFGFEHPPLIRDLAALPLLSFLRWDRPGRRAAGLVQRFVCMARRAQARHRDRKFDLRLRDMVGALDVRPRT